MGVKISTKEVVKKTDTCNFGGSKLYISDMGHVWLAKRNGPDVDTYSGHCLFSATPGIGFRIGQYSSSLLASRLTLFKGTLKLKN